MQADDYENRKYKNMSHTIMCILKEKGYLGFYKGLKICLIRSIPFNAANFFTYETMQKFLRKLKN